jgi:tetratricopeptide (TPR) repeat protein
MTFANALARAEADPHDAAALALLASRALAEGEEMGALALVAAGAGRAGSDARLWQWTALLHRALDRHAEALAAFAKAAALAPGDASIASGRAYAAIEAGLDAVELFERARSLNPANGEVLLGLAAARFAIGEGARGIAELDAVLARSPGWIAGHAGLARLRCLMGDPANATASLERALAAWPRDPALWQALILMLDQAGRFAEALDAIARGRAALGDSVFFDANQAVALSETGNAAAADALFAKLALDEEPFAMRRVRHLLRTGRVEAALPLIERWAVVPGSSLMWPHAAIAWRMTGDPRAAWLEGDPRLVSVIDLGDRLPPLDRLAAVLRGMHRARGQPLDQSVRGGTQTDGILFTRIDPEIRALRAAIVDAVAAHIAQLPPPDRAHPTLGPRRDRPIRFSGAWSVRLAGGGSHVNHIHPMGWFSSALYVSLPEPGQGDAGWLTLGEPQRELGLDLPPLRKIEPRPGRLVLFPSTMWHGTIPFAEGERLTVAFDVAPPR